MSDQVVAYERRSLPEGRRLDTVPLDLPARHFATRAFWFVPPDELMEEAGGDLLGALHAAEHALISVLPLLAMCDRWDIGGLSTNLHPQTLRPTVFVYDGHAGGVGIAQRGHDRFAGAGGERRARRGRLPLPRRLPLVRAVAEVRQPQRDARQGRRGAAPGGDGARASAAPAAALSRALTASAAQPPIARRRSARRLSRTGSGPSRSSAYCGVARSRSRSAQPGHPPRSRPARQRGSAGSVAKALANSTRAR